MKQEFLPAGYGQLRVRFQAIGKARESIVTFGYHPDTPSGDPFDDAANFLGYLSGTNHPFDASKISNQWLAKGTYCTWISESGPLVGTADVTITGTGTPSPLPLNCAFILRKQTALGGRKGRGRCFLPPCYVAEGSIDSLGTIPGSDVTALTTLWENFRTDAETGGYTLRLIHTWEPPGPPAGIVPSVITGLQLDNRIGTQRRRLR